MIKLKNFFNKDFPYIFLLLTVTLLTHYVWLNPNSIFAAGDWKYWYKETIIQMWQGVRPWVGWFESGAPNVQLQYFVFHNLWRMLVNIGLFPDLAIRLTVFFPTMILGALAPYYLFKHFTKNRFISFLVALFYSSNTYFLIMQTSNILLGFVNALAPLLLLSFIKSLENNRAKDWLLFSLVFFVGILYEIRIMLLVSFILIIYFVYFNLKGLKKYFANILISGLMLVLLNAFWLLPTVFSISAKGSISQVAGRGVWGEYLFDLPHAFILQHPNWTGSYPPLFFHAPALWYLWIIPLILLVPLIFLNKYKDHEKKFVVFFSLLSLIGILLSKEASPPFSGLYQWLYLHLPGFILFREASKFYLFTAVGYSGLLAYFFLLASKFKNRIYYGLLVIAVLILSLFNFKPLIFNEMGWLFTPKQIPKDYRIIAKHFFSDKNYYRSLSIPSVSRWLPVSLEHPSLGVTDLIQTNWKNFVKFKDMSGMPYKEDMMYIFDTSKADLLLDLASVKYLIVPLNNDQNEDDLFSFRRLTREYFIKGLDRQKYLKKIDWGMKNIQVYENLNPRPHIYITFVPENPDNNVYFQEIDWNMINSSRYFLHIKRVTDSFYINFSENYSSEWKLLSDGKEISGINHFQNKIGLNSFYMDLKKICHKDNVCHENNDGSYDLSLTLLFMPEKYFEMGIIISILSFIALLIFLTVAYLYDKKKPE